MSAHLVVVGDHGRRQFRDRVRGMWTGWSRWPNKWDALVNAFNTDDMSRAIVVLYIVSVSAVFCMYYKKAFGKSKPVPNHPLLLDNNTLNNTSFTILYPSWSICVPINLLGGLNLLPAVWSRNKDSVWYLSLGQTVVSVINTCSTWKLVIGKSNSCSSYSLFQAFGFANLFTSFRSQYVVFEFQLFKLRQAIILLVTGLSGIYIA